MKVNPVPERALDADDLGVATLQHQRTDVGTRVDSAEAARREQELCVAAMDSGDFDDMSDADWVALCERLGRDAVLEEDNSDSFDQHTLDFGPNAS
jgi:hypothetical protein